MMNKGKKDIKIRKMGLVCGILACIVGIGTAGATTMCMTADTTAIILDPSGNGTDSSHPTSNTWSVTLRNGNIVSGISTCNSTSGSWATAFPEYNDVFSQGTSGVHCWCRMTKPVRSAWVFRDSRSSASECASNCAVYCGDGVRALADFRRSVFGSAGQ